MKENTEYIHSILYINPYENPPNNLPRVLFEYRCSTHRPPENIKRKFSKILANLRARGIYGYGIGFTCIRPEGTKWSEEAKKRVRRKRLLTRIQKKASLPYFIEQEYLSRIQARKDYYLSEGEKIEYDYYSGEKISKILDS